MAKKESVKKRKYTRYEIARIVGARALQISQGADLKIKFTKKQLEDLKYNALAIAKLELKKGVIPIEVYDEVLEDKSSNDDKSSDSE